jgi:hypothetical protein
MVHATRILVDNISGTGPFMSVQQHLTDISEKAFRLLVPRYGMIFEEIQQRLDQDLEEYKDDEEREREEKKHHLYKLKQQLEQYLQELPVVGFNRSCLQLPNMFPQPVTFRTHVAVTVPTEKRRSEKLEWTSHHVLLSVSVCSNVPTYTEPICFVTEGDTSETVESCLQHLTDISEKAFRLLVPRYAFVF